MIQKILNYQFFLNKKLGKKINNYRFFFKEKINNSKKLKFFQLKKNQYVEKY